MHELWVQWTVPILFSFCFASAVRLFAAPDRNNRQVFNVNDSNQMNIYLISGQQWFGKFFIIYARCKNDRIFSCVGTEINFHIILSGVEIYLFKFSSSHNVDAFVRRLLYCEHTSHSILFYSILFMSTSSLWIYLVFASFCIPLSSHHCQFNAS